MNEITLANVLKKLTRDEDNKVHITARIPVKDEKFPNSDFRLLSAQAKILTTADLYPADVRASKVLDTFLEEIQDICKNGDAPVRTKFNITPDGENFSFSMRFSLETSGSFLKIRVLFPISELNSTMRESEVIRWTRKIVQNGCVTAQLHLPAVVGF